MIFSNNFGFQPCNGFDFGTNTCTDRRGKPGGCSCLEVQASKIYLLTYNMTVKRKFSNQSIWMEWPGPPALVSKSFQIPEIRGKVITTGGPIFFFLEGKQFYISLSADYSKNANICIPAVKLFLI